MMNLHSISRRELMRSALWASGLCNAALTTPMTSPALAETVRSLPPVVIERKIAGVTVTFPITVRISRLTPQAAITLHAYVGLSDLFAKSNDIAVAAGVERIDLGGGRLEHQGTPMNLEGNRLRVKVHFKLRLPPLPSSKGSVTAFFSPRVADNAVGLVAQDVKLAISNELVRGAASALDIDDKIESKIQSALAEVLSTPNAMLSLPPAATALGLSIENAEFITEGNTPFARISGTLPAAAGLLLGI